MVITMVYGRAMITIRPYDNRINGAIAEVSKNKNAAWPFGVATEGKLVPVLIAMVNKSKCARVIVPASSAAATSLIYTVATKTLSLIAERAPLARKNIAG